MKNWSLNEKPEALIIGGNENNILETSPYLIVLYPIQSPDAHIGPQSGSLANISCPSLSLQSYNEANQCILRPHN